MKGQLRNKLLTTANSFQNIGLSSSTLRWIFYAFKYLFSVPALTALLIINSSILNDNFLGSRLLQKIQEFSQEQQEMVLICLVMGILGRIAFFSIIYKNQSQILKLMVALGTLTVSLLTNFIATILIIIIHKTEEIVIQGLAGLLLASLAWETLLVSQLWVSRSYSVRNIFSHSGSTLQTFLTLFQTLLYCVTLFFTLKSGKESMLNFCFLPLLMLVYIIRIKLGFSSRYYINESSETLERSGQIVSLVFLTLNLIYILFDENLVRENFVSLVVIVSMFALWSSSSYTSFQQSEIYFLSIEDAIAHKCQIQFLEGMYHLWQSSEEEFSSLIISSIKKNHQYLCQKSICYCLEQSDDQKGSSLQAGRLGQSQSKYLRFFSGYLNEALDRIEAQNKDSKDIIFQVLYFRFQVFKSYISISKSLHSKKVVDFKDLNSQISSFVLKEQIKSYVDTKNKKYQAIDSQIPILLENTISQMHEDIFAEIHEKSKKWKYLTKGLCKSQEIELNISKQIEVFKRLQILYEKTKLPFRKSRAFNCLYLFYFQQIAFLSKAIDEIEVNLKELRIPVKYNEIIKNKELFKNIFDDRCTMLEMDLSNPSQLKNTEGQLSLVIKNCSETVRLNFDESKKHCIGSKLQSFFPAFLWGEVEVLLSEYLEEKSNLLNESAIDTYFTTKGKELFGGLMSLKVITQEDSISLIMLIFKKQAKNIVLVSENKIIQSTGSTYQKYFGADHEGLPLESLFIDGKESEKLRISDRESTNELFLIDGSYYSNGLWKQYITQIRESLKENKTMHSRSIKLKFQTVTDPVQANPKRTKQEQELSDSIEQIRAEVLQNSNLESQTGELRQIKRISAITQSRVELLGSKSFLVLKFKEVKKFKGLKEFKSDTEMMTTKKTLLKLSDPLQEGTEDGFEDQEEGIGCVIESMNMGEQPPKNKGLEQEIYHDASSVQSSTKTDSVSYFYHKFIENCLSLVRNPYQVRDSRIAWFVCFSLVFSILLSGLAIACYFVMKMGLYEVRDIFFADGAVSDNMQLTEFMYNRAMNFKQLKDNETELASIRNSAFHEREYLYNLTVVDLEFLIKNVTSMTSTKFYEYMRVQQLWYPNPSRPETVDVIETNQFMEYYYYCSREVAVRITSTEQSDIERVNRCLRLMKVNFPEMKRINHENLYLYQAYSDNTLELLNQLVIMFGLLHFFISAVIFLVFANEKRRRQQQTVESCLIYKTLPQKIVECTSDYYNNYANKIAKEKDLQEYQQIIEHEPLFLGGDSAATLRPNKNFFLSNHSKYPLSVYKMLIVLLLFNTLFAVVLIQIQAILGPIGRMMTNVNSLMDSENYLLEAYFDMKAEFIIDGNYSVDPKFFDGLLKSQQTNEVLFNKIAIESLELFSSYDDTYKANFIGLLINNTCQLAKDMIHPEQYQKCIEYFQIYMLDYGVITGMNFFTRQVRETIHQLQNLFIRYQSQDLPQSKREAIHATFDSINYREIDESIFYMFKMYQETQSRIYQSLEMAIQDIMSYSYYFIAVEVVLMSVIFPLYLTLNVFWQKIQLSDLYLSFLLVPAPVAKMIKSYASNVERILDYRNAE